MDLNQFLAMQYRWDAGTARHMTNVITSDLTEEELNWQAGSGHHSIWHNLWHMFLSNDYYSAAALDRPAVWDEGKWRDRIDLARMARAFDYAGNAEDGPVPRFVIADVPDTLVDELRSVPLASYLAYVDELIASTARKIESATDEQLQRRVTWYGRRQPAYVPLTSFSHVYRHIGMMEDIRGLVRGPGAGTASI
jgi:hypothetical protein